VVHVANQRFQRERFSAYFKFLRNQNTQFCFVEAESLDREGGALSEPAGAEGKVLCLFQILENQNTQFCFVEAESHDRSQYSWNSLLQLDASGLA